MVWVAPLRLGWPAAARPWLAIAMIPAQAGAATLVPPAIYQIPWPAVLSGGMR
jgi:hypothetical protein